MSAEEEVIRILKKNKVKLVATLPCEKVRYLLSLISKNFRHIPLSREEEGVGICAGAALAGARAAMLVQSSGVGNAINALCSLTKFYGLPLGLLVSWRGIYEEKVAAQIPMGRYLPNILDAAEIGHAQVLEREDIVLVNNELRKAYTNDEVRAALLSPKIWSGRILDALPRRRIRKISLPRARKMRRATLTRFEVLQAIAPYLDGKVVVCNLGYPSKELYAVKHQSSNFYMLGSMGMASPIGLGIALFTKKQVMVIDGDGSLLMNPSSLATIAQMNPKNLTIVAVDNGVHGSTGNQPTAANSCADLEFVARGFGIENSYKVYTKRDLVKIFDELDKGPNFIHALAKPYNEELPNVPLSAAEIKRNVMRFLS